MKKYGKYIAVPICIIAIIILFSCLYTTKENEYTVVKQFGKIVACNDTAGLRMKKPFIQSVTSITKARQLYDLPETEVITSDKKTMVVDAYVLWNITDAKVMIKALNGNYDAAQKRIDAVVYNALKNKISAMKQEDLIASRKSNIVDIESLTSVTERYGIKITDIKVKILDLPEENKESVYTRMITERQNIAAAFKAEGKSKAQVIKNETDKQVSFKLSEAKAKALELEAEGEATYMKTLSKAYNNKAKADFYKFSLQLDTLKKSVTKGQTTLVLDSDSPIAQLFQP